MSWTTVSRKEWREDPEDQNKHYSKHLKFAFTVKTAVFAPNPRLRAEWCSGLLKQDNLRTHFTGELAKFCCVEVTFMKAKDHKGVAVKNDDCLTLENSI